MATLIAVLILVPGIALVSAVAVMVIKASSADRVEPEGTTMIYTDDLWDEPDPRTRDL